MDLLYLLASRPGQPVPRDLIMTTLWPGLVMGEDSLARTVWRKQLVKAKDVYGDDADVLTRLNVRSAVRLAEQDDLIEEHQPPMNAEARA